jgi:hypothetical protein
VSEPLRKRLAAFAGGLRRPAALSAALGLALASTALPAADGLKFEATYSIVVSGISVGHASAVATFTPDGYTASINGSTSGIARLVSDATAKLAGSGRIVADRLLPASYILDTSENGDASHVSMALRGGAITDLTALPPLKPKPDRIPITSNHKRNILDPLSAFLVRRTGTSPPTADVCNRTIKVFDGWQRYDIALSYKATRTIEGRGEGYTGDVFVCTARYVPVAGHRIKQVQSLTENRRLEVWLAPLSGSPMMVPYKILIGTGAGDLGITATRFKVSGVSTSG